MIRHLGQAVAALADGHLAGEDRDRALTHLAICATCRDEVDRHRAMRARLATMASPDLPDGMQQSLLSLSILDPAKPAALPAAARASDRGAVSVERPARLAFAGAEAAAGSDTSGRRRVIAAGVLAAAALSGGALLGTRGPSIGGGGPAITPGSVELTRFERTTRSATLDDPVPAIAVAADR